MIVANHGLGELTVYGYGFTEPVAAAPAPTPPYWLYALVLAGGWWWWKNKRQKPGTPAPGGLTA